MRRRPTLHPLAKRRPVGALVAAIGSAVVVHGCASAPVVADLRPAYDAAQAAAVSTYLDCTGASDIVCQCRREGMTQEFADPSPGRFDQGYAALAQYRDNPDHLGHTAQQAESFAVRTIFAAIKKDVEAICSYHEEEAAN